MQERKAVIILFINGEIIQMGSCDMVSTGNEEAKEEKQVCCLNTDDEVMEFFCDKNNFGKMFQCTFKVVSVPGNVNSYLLGYYAKDLRSVLVSMSNEAFQETELGETKVLIKGAKVNVTGYFEGFETDGFSTAQFKIYPVIITNL